MLIDASALLGVAAGRVDVHQALRGRRTPAYLSVVTADALQQAVDRAADPAERVRRAAFVEAILDQLPVLPIDLSVSRVHRRLRREIGPLRRPIAGSDLWLAATCIARADTLVTVEPRDFPLVPGLKLEVWPLTQDS